MIYIKMESVIDINNSILEHAFSMIKRANIPMEYSVIVEKYKAPLVFSENDRPDYYEIFWYNSAGQLHSFNDMPSKISCRYGAHLDVEWHKNGEPFRNKFKFNRLIIKEKGSMYSMLTKDSKEKTVIEYMWLNKKGELHSIHDMPAMINEKGVYWYYKNSVMRYYNRSATELPCAISSVGEMAFCIRKDDLAEYVKFPFSTKHYGEAAKIGLKHYEKYVDWPIRSMLTV
jgi:hypothetical protein